MFSGCLSCLFTCNAVLLLGVCLHDVEASSCQRVIHKRVGDTVRFPSCLPVEGVTVAQWKHGGSLIADRDAIIPPKEFRDRLSMNPSDFSLTVNNLIIKDSGDFSFASEVNNTQRETVIITLRVHEPINTKPTVTINSTWHSNQSCTFLLECLGPPNINVTYKWAVRNQVHSGSRLKVTISAQEGDIDFTCTVGNVISEMGETRTVNCSKEKPVETRNFVVILGAAAGGCLVMVIVVGIAVVLCYRKQNRAGGDPGDLTVYADIGEVANEATLKPCSVYETIDHNVSSDTPAALTVYDQIQLNRVRETVLSPYQDIS